MKYDKEIIFGIASIPSRINILKDTINSVYDYSDLIIVGLNNYKEVPNYLKRNKIKTYLLDNSLGDAAKFYKIDNFNNHYYFSIDDDIIYPNDYVDKMINNLNGNPIIGVHGSIFKNNAKDFYDRKIYNFRNEFIENKFVDFLGCGTTLIDTSRFNISLKDFKKPNMGDIWLGILCKEQNIKPLMIKRCKNWLIYNNKMNNKETIFNQKIKPNENILKKLINVS